MCYLSAKTDEWELLPLHNDLTTLILYCAKFPCRTVEGNFSFFVFFLRIDGKRKGERKLHF